MNKTEYSVVIPVYKRRRLAIAAIKSVLNQKNIDNERVEIIVVDDELNSNIAKKNRKIYKSLSDNIVYLRNKYEEGPGGTRQTGLEFSQGKYITFLDSDDIMKSNYISKLSEHLESNNKIISVTCFSEIIFDKNYPLKETIKVIPLIIIKIIFLNFLYVFNNRNLYPEAFYLCQISHIMFRRKKLKNLKFNYDYRSGGEDWDFFLQCLKIGNMEIVPENLLTFRYSKGGTTDNFFNRRLKWRSYSLLIKRLPRKFSKSIFITFLKLYISTFSRL